LEDTDFAPQRRKERKEEEKKILHCEDAKFFKVLSLFYLLLSLRSLRLCGAKFESFIASFTLLRF
jgi:hypothetical protein